MLGGSERCPQERSQLVAKMAERRRRRLPTNGSQHLTVGGDAGHRGVRKPDHEARVGLPEMSLVHLLVEVLHTSIHEWLHPNSQTISVHLGQASEFAHQPQHRRAPHGRTKHCPNDGVDAIERVWGRRSHRSIDHHDQLRSHLFEHDVEQLIFRGEPVQHGLLPYPHDPSNFVERDGVDATRSEEVESSIENALARTRFANRRK